MSTFTEYRDRAAECLTLSRATADPAIRAVYLKLAQSWVTLAEQVEARALPDAPLTSDDAAGEIA